MKRFKFQNNQKSRIVLLLAGGVFIILGTIIILYWSDIYPTGFNCPYYGTYWYDQFYVNLLCNSGLYYCDPQRGEMAPPDCIRKYPPPIQMFFSPTTL